jgi:hypothetical protein
MYSTALYSLSGTITLLGTAAFLYGLASHDFVFLSEGGFLMWLGFSITVNAMELMRVPSLDK